MKKIISILAIAFTLSACNVATSDESVAVMDKETQIAEGVAVQSSARGKSVNFIHSLQQERAKVGQPFVVDISFLGQAESYMQVRYGTTPELVMNTSELMNVEFNASGKSSIQKITVTARSEGIHFINVYRVGDVKLKPAAIKVIAGNKSEKDYMRTEGEIVEDSNGHAVIEMPAEEG